MFATILFSFWFATATPNVPDVSTIGTVMVMASVCDLIDDMTDECLEQE